MKELIIGGVYSVISHPDEYLIYLEDISSNILMLYEVKTNYNNLQDINDYLDYVIHPEHQPLLIQNKIAFDRERLLNECDGFMGVINEELLNRIKKL